MIIGTVKKAARTANHVFLAETWFLCNGQAINRLTYAQLFALLGVTFGPGDGLTTFNIPNFTGVTPIGARAAGPGGHVLAATGGTVVHQHGIGGLNLAHAYNHMSDPNGDAPVLADPAGFVGAAGNGHSHGIPNVFSPPAVASDGGNTLMPYLVVGFFIRVL